MRLLMLKLLMIATLLSTSAFSNTDLDKKIIAYEKQRVAISLQRAGGELKNVELILKKDLNKNGWVGYTFNLEFKVQDKEISQRDTLFSDGKNITMELINLKNKRSYKTMMYPTLTKDFFNKSYLIEGNPNAKHSLVIFSDPLCPICIDEIPFVLKQIIKNPKNIAVYYYHLPLEMHPTATVLSKASILAREAGIKNVDYRVYQANFPEKYKFDAYEEKNEQKVLNFFNKEFGTKFTIKQINEPRLNKMIENDIKMSEKAFVAGTPSLFFDGEYDYTRTKFENYLK